MFQDLRYGVRILFKHPGCTCVAALTLAVGIGANTAMFSLIDAVLLKMLPVNNPERLVLLSHSRGGTTVTTFPYRTYRQIRDQNEVLSGVLAYHPLRLSVSVDGQPEPALAGQHAVERLWPVGAAALLPGFVRHFVVHRRATHARDRDSDVAWRYSP